MNTSQNSRRSFFLRLLVFGTVSLSLLMAGLEFSRLAWGTGDWIGRFSLQWGIAFLFVLLVFGLIAFASLAITLRPCAGEWALKRIATLSGRVGSFRYLILGVILLLPSALVLFRPFWEALAGPWMRSVFVAVFVLLFAALWSRGQLAQLRQGLLLGALGVVVVLILGQRAALVTDYPFSLSWSEGNRMWDYSIAFGRERYEIPHSAEIPVLISSGRQILWGLPFLYPGLTIWQERLWDAILAILPSVLLGWLALGAYGQKIDWKAKLAMGVWSLVFLSQGPIYAPLLLAAILVGIARQVRPGLVGLLLVGIASYYAAITRFTWMFAPGIYAAMLALADRPLLEDGRFNARRAVWVTGLGLAGLVGGYVVPNLIEYLQGSGAGIAVETVGDALTKHELLWYRLLPNPTLGPGILISVIIVAAPVLGVLIYSWRKGLWLRDAIQAVGILAAMTAFLVVGLIISVKSGGGSNLHNLDMFLVGAVFLVGSMVGRAFQSKVAEDILGSRLVLALIALAVVVPLARVVVGAEPPERMSAEAAEIALQHIQTEVDQAARVGEVLFIDQRQLLTFGFIEDVELIPEYEKKYLMNEALADSSEYFEGFYEELAAHQYAMIVSEPLKIQYQGRTHGFGEENDAWVWWISEPVLCYYEPVPAPLSVPYQLLVPRKGGPESCSEMIGERLN